MVARGAKQNSRWRGFGGPGSPGGAKHFSVSLGEPVGTCVEAIIRMGVFGGGA
jgi:hypothetical protein